MRFSNPLCTAFLALSVATSGAVFAAANPDAVHLAVDSLLVATSKMSVVNYMRANGGKLPTSNAQAHLGAPSSMTTSEIKSIVVDNRGALNVYLSPTTGTHDGVIRYEPTLFTNKNGKKAVRFNCTSPNIPEIASITAGCRYQAASAK